MRASILKDLVVIMLHSVTPPDRVGVCEQAPLRLPLGSYSPVPVAQVIRKLRWGLSLQREGDDFIVDTTQQRHKSKCSTPAR